jgi:hypothetical protein
MLHTRMRTLRRSAGSVVLLADGGRGAGIEGGRLVSSPTGLRADTISREELSEEERARADIEAGMEAHREIVAHGGNAAARSRSASELIRLARELERLRTGGFGRITVEDARAQLDAKLSQIIEHRQRDAESCTACNGTGYIVKQRDPGPGARDEGGGV